MGEDNDVKANIASQELRLGDAPHSTLSIGIENTTGVALSYVFYITIPDTLVSADKAGNIAFEGEATRDKVEQPSQAAKWRVGATKGTSIEARKRIEFTCSKLEVTKLGAAEIILEWGRFKSSAMIGSAKLPVTVLAPEDLPQIKSFEAEQPVLTRSKHGATTVKLTWETDPKSRVELLRLGKRLLPYPGEASGPSTIAGWWSDTITDGSTGLQPYELRATFNDRTVSRWLFVRVQDAGWNKIECRQGAPSLLLNDGDNRLFGVLLGDESAAVYRLDPEAGGLGQKDKLCIAVPQGMEKSPGVFFKNEIWLMGGSQIDPMVCSNQVWSFDPTENKAEQKPNANWTPRMGHACVVFAGRIWILGGSDENGNPLSDVWSCDPGSSTTWSEESLALPEPRCLLSATEFDGRLFIYGGADAPLGTPLPGLYYRGATDTAWHELRLHPPRDHRSAPGIAFGEAFGGALCVRGVKDENALSYLATSERRSEIGSTLCTLSNPSYSSDLVDQHSDPIPQRVSWPTTKGNDLQQVFRLSAVRFKSFIFVVSLVDENDERSLTYLVQ